jgi:type II restriction/modification system DNA methylase subunit YeeA
MAANQAITPLKALNPAYKKIPVNQAEINCFKNNLSDLLENIQHLQREKNYELVFKDFLERTYYGSEYFINSKNDIDLVIHNGSSAKTSVGVLIEAKSPTNKAEMPSTSKLNSKALQELVLYYLREVITGKNVEVKHLIITNVNEWFIFDAQHFQKYFADNKKLVQQFNDFTNGTLGGNKTDFFYKNVAAPFIDEIQDKLEHTHFELSNYQNYIVAPEGETDKKLIPLYKIFSPEHLLKLSFINDSNSLDSSFYKELLHLIGLVEVKDGGKKVIRRPDAENRNGASLLESAIVEIESLDKLSRVSNLNSFGVTKDERLFGVGLELIITWVNRILFLKLLEAQLISYNKGEKAKEYAFLNLNKISDFDDLNKLFFRVLAKVETERDAEMMSLFANVPYLNSSLFEPTDLEHEALFISNLNANTKLPIVSGTVLKDAKGKKQTGELKTIEYLFAFLDAYDFGAITSDEIPTEKKDLINASVLGLIFEKINGYKDGSFFTPGFITMYMCKETITRAVLQKFNETKGWHCKTITELHNEITDRAEANKIINSLKLCDPAVGSGHFLVSALNELIALKSELNVLVDCEGKTLKDYTITVQNDELIVEDENGDPFTYNPNNKESHRVQKTLFTEKETLIENCLFGVDINPNSVKICRLRLWIELLKNAYYKQGTKQLETLPNIDINIKCGNSLVSRFAIDTDMKKALKKSKWTIDSYRIAVDTYRNAKDKEEKREMERLINDIKTDFRSEISSNDPKLKKLTKWKEELFLLTTGQLFELGRKEKAAWNKKVEKLTKDSKKLESEIEEIKSNKIFENAFEWRFEFPEVLNNDGDFVGFDCVIGNPPYVQLQSIKEVSEQLKRFGFETYSSMGDLYALFYERGNEILQQRGVLNFITGSAWMRSNYGQSLRSYFNQKTQLLEVIDLSDCEIFESATVLTSIISFTKKQEDPEPIKAIRFTRKDQARLINLADEVKINHTKIPHFPESSWIILESKSNAIKLKIEAEGKPLKDWEIEINYGIKTGFNKAFVIDKETRDKLIVDDPKSEELIKPLLRGRDVHKYYFEDSELFLIGTFPSLNLRIDNYPAIKTHLENFLPKLKQTGETFINVLGEKEKSRKKTSGDWFETQDSISYWKSFLKPKIIYPNMTKFLPFTLDVEGNYTNQKCFVLSGERIYYLAAFLNSKLFRFCFEESFPELQGNTRELNKVIFETIPVKHITDEEPFIEKVTELLNIKKQTPTANTTELEKQLDQMVYELYGLTEDEIKIVEGSV